MRSLPRSLSGAVAAALPALAAAQAASDAPQTGKSGWNWAIGIAALVVVIALARVMFGRRRGAGELRG